MDGEREIVKERGGGDSEIGREGGERERERRREGNREPDRDT